MSRPGALLPNLLHFVRLLRAAGLPIGPGRAIDAVRAVEAVGIHGQEDLYWALHAMLINGPEHRELFHQAFHLFWKDPLGARGALGVEAALAALLPRMSVPFEEYESTVPRRLSDLMAKARSPREATETAPPEVDVRLTYSDQEVFRARDFEQMSADEVRRARAVIARMSVALKPLPTRRFRPSSRGSRVDMRATLRAALRGGGAYIPLQWRNRVERPPALVVLCDVSGSMDRYARLLLHFFHALTNARDRVFTFVFGTRLTNITRHLKHRDVDRALARVGVTVGDWSGGTRIGASLKAFNQSWSRRVLGHGAVVLLVTDGLDREGGEGLALEAERLRRSCRSLIWLNPLLRYEGFEAKAAGIRALLPHVDVFRPVHNIESLTQLAELLGQGGGGIATGLLPHVKYRLAPMQ